VPDQMTSRERIFSALTMSQMPDQVPVVPLLMIRAIREVDGLTADEALNNVDAMVAAKEKAVRKFGGDVIIAGTDLFTPVENIGAGMDYLPKAQPSLVEHPTPTKEDFYRLRDTFTYSENNNGGRVARINEEIRRYVANGWKDTHAVVTPVGGPITTAQLMTGSSVYLDAMQEDPDYAKEVCDFALEVCKQIVKQHFEAGVDAVNILDPFMSSDILPREMYLEFARPQEVELYRYIKEDLGGPAFFHTCTYIQPVWRDMASIDGNININGDFYPGMDKAKRAIGGEISLMGALAPFTTLLHESPKEVELEVKKHAAEVGYNGGYVMMPGCDIDWTIPEENLRAMIDTCASIKYGPAGIDVPSLGDLSDVFLPGHPQHRATRARTTEGDATVDAAHDGRLEPKTPQEEVNDKLIQAIMDYDHEAVVEWTTIGLDRGMSAQDIVFEGLSEGMKVVGDMYERNERFVTDMLKAAKTMDKAMPILTPHLEASGSGDGPTGTVVMGLVRGNTQDIGKNLCCLMLKANGYKVIDMGKNVKPEDFVRVAEENDAVGIGMSVMTNSSSVYVDKTCELLKEKGIFDKYIIMTGGASSNKAIAERNGIKYGSDANAAVSIIKDGLLARR